MKNQCPRITICPMFKYLSLESSKEILIRQYCTGDFSKCKRKQLFDERKPVDDKLLPTGDFL